MNDEILSDAVCGDRDAIMFLRCISLIAHTWDDLHDRDREVSNPDIDKAFWTALIELPSNEFYRANEAVLRPLLAQSIINWQIANKLEANDERLEIAYIIRSSYIDLAVMCALIIGGAEHASGVGVALRMWNHGETPKEYLDHLKAERKKRGE